MDQKSAWPALTWESAPWDVHPMTGLTRQERRWVGRSYQAAVVPTISTRHPILSSDVVAHAEEAAATLSRFDTQLGVLLSPYAAILLRSEAASSSQIEGITAGARAIAEAEATGHGSGNAALVVANTSAMVEALRADGALDVVHVLAMHRLLLGGFAPELAGQVRDDQVWIGGGNSPHSAEFVPPVASRVPAALQDLVSFMDRDDLPVVVQAAIAHAHFETIHPFSDGNGRTGRALIHAVLKAKGLVRNAAIPISAGLLVRRPDYIDALTAYREGRPDAIVSELSRAAILAVDEGRRLVEATQTVRSRWAAQLAGVRSDSSVHRLADGLIGQPVVTVHQVRQILGTQANVHRHLDVLVERGVLLPTNNFKARNVVWRAQDVLDELNAYAERLGRRAR